MTSWLEFGWSGGVLSRVLAGFLTLRGQNHRRSFLTLWFLNGEIGLYDFAEFTVSFVTVQIVATYKQSAYKQSGWLEPPEVSNRGAWARAADAIQPKQFSLGGGCVRKRS